MELHTGGSYERGLAPDPTGGGHMGGSAPAIDGPQLLDQSRRYMDMGNIEEKWGFLQRAGVVQIWS